MKTEICPRCNGIMSEHPALSRTDDKTSVCSDCGMDEAIETFVLGARPSQHNWPTSPKKFVWRPRC